MTKYGLLGLAAIFSGCMTPLPELGIEQWSDDIFSQERKTYIVPRHIDPTQRQFAFSEAMQRAVATSSELRNNKYSLSLAKIASSQARSEIWPRFYIDGFYEIPLNNKEVESGIDGGISINYDLTKALFRRDLITAASVKHQKAVTEARLFYSKLYGKTLNQITESQILKLKLQLLDRTLQALYKEQKAIQSVAGIKGWPDAGDWQLDAEIRKHERLKRVSQSRIRYLSQDLKQRLAVESENELIISDADEVLAAITSRYSVQTTFQNQLSQVLRKRADIRMAVLDIMLSVLNLRKVEILRFPQIGMSVGYGDFYLRTSKENVSAIATLNVTIPLFDFGDIKRKHQIAQINDGLAREQLKALCRRVGNNLRATIEEANVARTDFIEATIWSEKSLQRVQRIESLYENNRIEHKDRFQAIIAAAGTELDMLEAKLRWHAAAIALAVARADELVAFSGMRNNETAAHAN